MDYKEEMSNIWWIAITNLPRRKGKGSHGRYGCLARLLGYKL
jgi:hypothetical protein